MEHYSIRGLLAAAAVLVAGDALAQTELTLSTPDPDTSEITVAGGQTVGPSGLGREVDTMSTLGSS